MNDQIWRGSGDLVVKGLEELPHERRTHPELKDEREAREEDQ
jgi:hypothetical protein